MTAAILLALALAALAYLAAPLVRRDALETEERQEPVLDELRELHARQQMLLASLKDLEDDRATDKIDAADYERLNGELAAQAMEVMQRLDQAEQEHDRLLERERDATRPLRHPAARRPDGKR